MEEAGPSISVTRDGPVQLEFPSSQLLESRPASVSSSIHSLSQSAQFSTQTFSPLSNLNPSVPGTLSDIALDPSPSSLSSAAQNAAREPNLSILNSAHPTVHLSESSLPLPRLPSDLEPEPSLGLDADLIPLPEIPRRWGALPELNNSPISGRFDPFFDSFHSDQHQQEVNSRFINILNPSSSSRFSRSRSARPNISTSPLQLPQPSLKRVVPSAYHLRESSEGEESSSDEDIGLQPEVKRRRIGEAPEVISVSDTGRHRMIHRLESVQDSVDDESNDDSSLISSDFADIKSTLRNAGLRGDGEDQQVDSSDDGFDAYSVFDSISTYSTRSSSPAFTHQPIRSEHRPIPSRDISGSLRARSHRLSRIHPRRVASLFGRAEYNLSQLREEFDADESEDDSVDIIHFESNEVSPSSRISPSMNSQNSPTDLNISLDSSSLSSPPKLSRSDSIIDVERAQRISPPSLSIEQINDWEAYTSDFLASRPRRSTATQNPRTNHQHMSTTTSNISSYRRRPRGDYLIDRHRPSLSESHSNSAWVDLDEFETATDLRFDLDEPYLRVRPAAPTRLNRIRHDARGGNIGPFSDDSSDSLTSRITRRLGSPWPNRYSFLPMERFGFPLIPWRIQDFFRPFEIIPDDPLQALQYRDITAEDYDLLLRLDSLRPSSSVQQPASRQEIDSLLSVCPSDEDLNSRCCICLDEFKAEVMLLELHCAHRFHNECIKEWLGISRTCPFCKQDISTRKLDDVKHPQTPSVIEVDVTSTIQSDVTKS